MTREMAKILCLNKIIFNQLFKKIIINYYLNHLLKKIINNIFFKLFKFFKMIY